MIVFFNFCGRKRKRIYGIFFCLFQIYNSKIILIKIFCDNFIFHCKVILFFDPIFKYTENKIKCISKMNFHINKFR